MGSIFSCCNCDDNHEEISQSSQKKNIDNLKINVVKTRVTQPYVQQSSKPRAIVLSGPKFAKGLFESKYSLKSVIGTGSTSVCHLCVNVKLGIEFACKIIDKRAIESRYDGLLQQFSVEIEVLQSLRHPSIIHLEDVYQTDDKIYMVTELMRGGELFDYIVGKGTLSELEASEIVRNVISAVAYMHSNGIIHRDLKPENLLLTSKSRGAQVKIIDFGLAKLLNGNQTKSFLGTRGYLAPELLRREAYSKSVDVWALGVIVYVLLCGCLPFDDDGSKIGNDQAAKEKFGLRFPRWAKDLSESAKDLLRHMLEIDLTKRFTSEQALAHPWVSGKEVSNKYLQSPKHLRKSYHPQRPSQEAVPSKVRPNDSNLSKKVITKNIPDPINNCDQNESVIGILNKRRKSE